jgi:hypothetical protein
VRLSTRATEKIKRETVQYSDIYLKLLTLLPVIFICWLLSVQKLDYPSSGATTSLDDSWLMSLAAISEQKQWLGRDIFFPHGILSQFVGTAGTFFNNGQTAYDAYPFSRIIFLSVIPLLMLTAIMLIPRVSWKTAPLLFLAAFLLGALVQARGVYSIICMAALALVMSSPVRWKRLAGTGLAAALCFAGQLFSFDQGFIPLVASTCLIIFFLVYSLLPGGIRRPDLMPPLEFVYMLLSFLGSYFLILVAYCLYFSLSSPAYTGFFDYFWQNLELIRATSLTLGLAWQLESGPTIWLGLILFYLPVFVLFNLRRFLLSEAYLLVGLLGVALLWTRSAAIRSDMGHINYAFAPALIMLLLCCYDWPGKSLTGYIFRGIAAILLVVWAFISPFNKIPEWEQFANLFNGSKNAFARLSEAHNKRFPPEVFVPTGLPEALDPDKGLLNFPYDNYIGIGLGKPLVAPYVQPYTAGTVKLQETYVRQLAQQQGTFEVLYGLDQLAVDPIDNVQHITRSPLVFEYLYRNFELKTRQLFGKGYLVLSPRAIPVEPPRSESLSFQFREGTDGNYSLQLDKPANCSLVRLYSEIEYPLMAQVGRPNALVYTVFSGESEVSSGDLVPLEEGKTFYTYLQLIDPAGFAQVFGGGPVPQRLWDGIKFRQRASGFLEVRPSKVTVSRVECVVFPDPVFSPRDILFDVQNPERWRATNLQPVRDDLGLWKAGNDPQLQNMFRLDLCAADFTYLHLKMSVSKDITRRYAQVYYSTSAQNSFSEERVILIPLAADAEIHSYWYDLSFLKLGSGVRLTGIRLDPVLEGNPDGPSQIKIEDFRLLRKEFGPGCGT